MFYALDLGGTNLRVLSVEFGGKPTEPKQISIPPELMIGTREVMTQLLIHK